MRREDLHHNACEHCDTAIEHEQTCCIDCEKIIAASIEDATNQTDHIATKNWLKTGIIEKEAALVALIPKKLKLRDDIQTQPPALRMHRLLKASLAKNKEQLDTQEIATPWRDAYRQGDNTLQTYTAAKILKKSIFDFNELFSIFEKHFQEIIPTGQYQSFFILYSAYIDILCAHARYQEAITLFEKYFGSASHFKTRAENPTYDFHGLTYDTATIASMMVVIEHCKTEPMQDLHIIVGQHGFDVIRNAVLDVFRFLKYPIETIAPQLNRGCIVFSAKQLTFVNNEFERRHSKIQPAVIENHELEEEIALNLDNAEENERNDITIDEKNALKLLIQNFKNMRLLEKEEKNGRENIIDELQTYSYGEFSNLHYKMKRRLLIILEKEKNKINT